MTAQTVLEPYPFFADRNGVPLTDGKIYIGVAGANPITNPTSVYYDAALTQPAAQPIRTSAGYAMNSGTPTRLFVNVEQYSLLVQTVAGATVYSVASASVLNVAQTITYEQTAEELAAGVTPVNLEFIPQFDEVRRLDAAIDDSTDDRAVFQSLEDLGGLTTLYPGTYVVRPTNTSPFDFGNTTSDVFRAVDLDASGYTLVGFGATIHLKSHTVGLAGGDFNYVFATDKNTTISQNRVLFIGVSFNNENDADAVNSNHRFAYVTGVRGLRYLLTEARSSGARRGYTAHIQNCEDVQIVGHRHYKNTGGFNWRYVDNGVIVGNVWRDFSECIDFDGTSRGVAVVGNGFVSTQRTNQVWDINGQRDGVFMGAHVNTVGQICNISYKDTTPDTFAGYLANENPVVTMTPAQRIVVSGVVGSAIGQVAGGGATMLIGNDWGSLPHDGFEPVTDIVVRDVLVKDCVNIVVQEATRIVFDTVHMQDVACIAGVYALNLQSETGSTAELQWSDLDASLRNIHIKGSERGGIRLNHARRAEVIGCKVSDINTLGGTDFALQVNNMATRGAQIDVDHNDFEGDVQFSANLAAIANWAATTTYVRSTVVKNGTRYYRAISSTGVSAGAGGPTGITSPITDGTVTWEWMPEPFRIVWGNHNRLRGSLTTVTDAHRYLHGQSMVVPIGTLAATGTVELTLFAARRRCYISFVNFTASANVAANATNYRTLSTRSVRAGVDAAIAIPDTTTNSITAHVPYDGGFAANEPDAYLEPGDVIYFRSSSVNAGVAITGLVAHYEVLFL